MWCYGPSYFRPDQYMKYWSERARWERRWSLKWTIRMIRSLKIWRLRRNVGGVELQRYRLWFSHEWYRKEDDDDLEIFYWESEDVRFIQDTWSVSREEKEGRLLRKWSDIPKKTSYRWVYCQSWCRKDTESLISIQVDSNWNISIHAKIKWIFFNDVLNVSTKKTDIENLERRTIPLTKLDGKKKDVYLDENVTD